jgi:transketolase
MLNEKLNLNEDVFRSDVVKKSTKDGYGQGLLLAGNENENVVALCADLTESTKTDLFAKQFPKRFIQVGIAEQNMAGIAAGLALSGKIPFATSHAGFSPAVNWAQIRLSVCISNLNVKIIGTHSGFSNGPDGVPDQALEDIALMRVLPNMTVISPIDYIQAQKAVLAATKHKGPVYIRLSKEPLPSITTEKTPFEIGKGQLLIEGTDLTIISTGSITCEALIAAKELFDRYHTSAEVIALPTIKPLDKQLIIQSLSKTKRCITVEEHQKIGGLGSAIAEFVCENNLGTPVVRIGVEDTFGESGKYSELIEKYHLDAGAIVKTVGTKLRL